MKLSHDGAVYVSAADGKNSLLAHDGSLKVAPAGKMAFPAIVSGRYYPTFAGLDASTASTTLGSSKSYFYPWYCHAKITVAALSVKTSSSVQGVNSSIKLALYGTDANGLPFGAPIVANNTGAVTTSTNTIVDLDVTDTVIYPGLYWVSIKTPLGSGPTQPSYFAMSSSNIVLASYTGMSASFSTAEYGFLSTGTAASSDFETVDANTSFTYEAGNFTSPIVFVKAA